MKIQCGLCHLLLIAVLPLFGCASSEPFLGRVVEKSKSSAPVWVELEPWAFHYMDGRYGYVGVKRHIADLELGIKQTWLLVSENLVRTAHRSTIDKLASVNKESFREHRRQLEDMIFKHLGKISKDLILADLYFKRSEQKGYGAEAPHLEATVYVFVSIREGVFREAINDLVVELKSSHLSEIANFAASLEGYRLNNSSNMLGPVN